MSDESKELENYDQSGFEFTKELLSGDTTGAVNFDRIQKHPEKGYLIFEYLLCEETQYVTPYTSHPNRYWHRNQRKFLSLWRMALEFGATLILVNYAKKGTRHEDKIKTIEVTGVTCHGLTGLERKWAREEFKAWFRKLNNESRTELQTLVEEVSELSDVKTLSGTVFSRGKYCGRSIGQVAKENVSYLKWAAQQELPESPAARAYLKKICTGEME